MKHISILVPYMIAAMPSIVDPRTMFTGVNEFLKESGKPALFKVQLVGLTKTVKFNDGLYSVRTDILLADLKKTDLIIIPRIKR
ncbi:MAG: hypothetical protein WKG06_35225 [Segetibacter sp.]